MAEVKKFTAAEIKANAKAEVLSEIMPKLEELNAEMVGNVAYVPRTIGDQEVWVEVKLTTKQYTDTVKSKAFDPFEARAVYEEDMAIKKAEAEAKAKVKADKAKSKKSRARKVEVEVDN